MMPFSMNAVERKLWDKPYRFNFLLRGFQIHMLLWRKMLLKKQNLSTTVESLVGALGETRRGAVTGDWAGLVGFLAGISWGWKDCYFCFLKGLSFVYDSPSRNSFLGLRYISRKFNLSCKYISRDKSHVHPIPGIKTLMQVFLKTHFREYYLREIM